MNSIRKATIQDLEPLAHLFDGYRVFYEQTSDLIVGKIFLKERITNKESEIFIALNNEAIITGFVQLYPIFSSTRMKKLWLLNDLFVNPVYRGQGISKLLMGKAKEFSQQSGSCGLILETAKINAIGNRLCPSVGFTLDTDHNYYFCDTE
ncbi:MAG: Acetyltransferase, family [Chitinophagaceae bacterium]|nr:Acetyltransferase, family [Chitinophagaceae bacterium]